MTGRARAVLLCVGEGWLCVAAAAAAETSGVKEAADVSLDVSTCEQL